MSYAQQSESLEREWPEAGFFWKLRQGEFASSDFERALRTVTDVRIDDDAVVPRRIVSLLWYIPLFMQWQLERVREKGRDVKAYTAAVGTMTAAIEQLLGVP